MRSLVDMPVSNGKVGKALRRAVVVEFTSRSFGWALETWLHSLARKEENGRSTFPHDCVIERFGRMMLKALGYVGARAKSLDDWVAYGTRLLGMEVVEQGASNLALRMDDRRQRLVVSADGGEGLEFLGFEVSDPSAIEALGAQLEQHEISVERAPRSLADRRFVEDLIAFKDPSGNRIEVFCGQDTALEPFEPGRPISGFRTGPLGMGHVVLTTSHFDEMVAFYRDVLGFHLSDYFTSPIQIHFFHLNARHHTLGLLQWPTDGIHHLMIEVNYLDDVGQAYDIAQLTPDLVAQTLGRHINDHVLSFYTRNPSNFMTEYGWGGRSITPASWTPKEVVEGPSLWGHERLWLPPDQRALSRDLRMKAASEGLRIPIDVQEGTYRVGPGTGMLRDSVAEAKRRGYI
jgi:2,3-dihydroxybiphenyl 1,2-dioxygenase